MATDNLDSGVKAEDLEAAFAPKPKAKPAPTKSKAPVKTEKTTKTDA